MNQTPDNSKYLAKVKALLDRSVDGNSPQGERDNALRMATAIMAKHRILESDLVNIGSDGSEIIARRNVLDFGKPGPKARRLYSLAHGIAEPMGVSALYSFRSGDGHLYGRRDSIEQVIALYHALSSDALIRASKLKAIRKPVQLEGASASAIYDYERENSTTVVPSWATAGELAGATKVLRNDFMTSYGNQIDRRMSALYHEADVTHDGSLLPMLMSDFKRSQELHPANVKSMGHVSYGGTAGHTAGRGAADRASLIANNTISAPKMLQN